MADKTNYAQSLMHMIKGNLGTGILAMPASFAHTGLVNALIGLPILCIMSTYCIHLLIKSSQQLESKTKGTLELDYASLAKHSFCSGPQWMRSWSSIMCRLVDTTLLIAQIGVCCVYLVFVVDNITSIMGSYNITLNKRLVFAAIFPIALLLSYIRTLTRLAIASGVANLLQVIGISLILEYLVRDLKHTDTSKIDSFRPLNEVALGFGSAMFAFEGISVVLPVYTRMRQPQQMSGWLGVVNLSYVVLLILYFVVGFFGYLKFGHAARDSITLNLPPEPLYDAVRLMFTTSIFLTYPLQFYVPQGIIWAWAKKQLLLLGAGPTGLQQDAALQQTVPTIAESATDGVRLSAFEMHNSMSKKAAISTSTPPVPTLKLAPPSMKSIESTVKTLDGALAAQQQQQQRQQRSAGQATMQQSRSLEFAPSSGVTGCSSDDCGWLKYEYACRTVLVVLTFVLAMSVPKLNLLMDLIGSITGTTLSLILPAMIHIATFWDESRVCSKTTMVIVNGLLIIIGFVGGACGAVSSIWAILQAVHNAPFERAIAATNTSMIGILGPVMPTNLTLANFTLTANSTILPTL